MRCSIEAIVLILWPVLMSAARGYHDAGTVFGDMLVAGLFIICMRCTVSCLESDKAKRETIEIQYEKAGQREVQNNAERSCS